MASPSPQETTRFKSIKDVPEEELMAPGTPACAGCPGTLGMRLALKVLGKNTVIVNPAGCMTLLTVYPYTPLKVNWVHLAIENAGAGAAGVKAAAEALGRDLNVITHAGDGATYDIGLQSLSGALERRDKIIYFCYDNEGYGNTGFQKSGATPKGSITTTTPQGKRAPIGHIGRKKDIFSIVIAHDPEYAATASLSQPLDWMRKVEKAKEATKRGPAFLLLHAPCPTGWGFDPKLTIEYARRAVESGAWVLKEYERGKKIRITYTPKKRIPVVNYIKGQKRFDHLFAMDELHMAFPHPTPVWQKEAETEIHTGKGVLDELQSEIDAFWNEVEKTNNPNNKIE